MANANGAATAKRTTMAFRDDLLQRKRLELIQAAKQHDDLSDTLREAVAEYVEGNRHLLGAETPDLVERESDA